jgi:sodium/potassium-transporting ATPase subunit alpha
MFCCLTNIFQVVESIAFLDHHFLVSEIDEKISEAPEPRFFAGLNALHHTARLCNGAKFDSATADKPIHERTVKGDPTDTALLRFSEGLSVPALDIDTPALLSSWRKPFEIPFNSKNKWMLSVAQEIRTTKGDITEKDSTTWMLVKGAPDMLVKSCTTVMRSDGAVVPFDEESRQHMNDLQSNWSSEGQRVLALYALYVCVGIIY